MNTLCKTCHFVKKEYNGPHYCDLTARDTSEYKDEPDCANYQPKENDE